MLEDFFVRPPVLARLRGGLLGTSRADLATLLNQAGDTRDTIRGYLRAGKQFGRWCSRQGYTVAEAEAALGQRYISGLHRSRGERQPKAAEGLSHLLRLWQHGRVVPCPSPPMAADPWLMRYDAYLDQVLGAAVTTRQSSLRMAPRVLTAGGGAGAQDWGALRAQVLTEFVRQEALTTTGGGRQVRTAVVRSFRRFLVFCGALRPGREAAVPTLRPWTPATLPQRLTPEEVECVLAPCARNHPKHRRDRAILVLRGRLGRRAHELVALRLEDIDWREGRRRIRPGKTRHERVLPLSRDVGSALATYLRHGRPASSSRVVFLNFQAPFRPFAGASASSQLAKRARLRAGIPARPRLGAPTFRHTAASQMVNRGASFKDVADVLGHQSLQTTGIDATLDLAVLVAVALPWGGEAS